jgi:hypothetical protein
LNYIRITNLYNDLLVAYCHTVTLSFCVYMTGGGDNEMEEYLEHMGSMMMHELINIFHGTFISFAFTLRYTDLLSAHLCLYL